MKAFPYVSSVRSGTDGSGIEKSLIQNSFSQPSAKVTENERKCIAKEVWKSLRQNCAGTKMSVFGISPRRFFLSASDTSR